MQNILIGSGITVIAIVVVARLVPKFNAFVKLLIG